METTIVVVLAVAIGLVPAFVWGRQRRRSRSRFRLLADEEFLTKMQPWDAVSSSKELMDARDDLASYADIPPKGLDPSMPVAELHSVDGWRHEDLDQVYSRLESTLPPTAVIGELVAQWAGYRRKKQTPGLG